MVERSARSALGGVGTTQEGYTAAAPSTGRNTSTGEMIRSGTDQAIDEAKTMVRDLADTQRKKAAEGLGGMAQALHRTAHSLDAESKTMARYTELAAERLDDAARYLKQSNWGDLIEGAESFARRQPYWFIGGAVATGFLAARFFKSPAETRAFAEPQGFTTPTAGDMQ
jgi:ElaB/YqjD/DUF883 family membrane-anchored ribosome-binding protein